MMKNNSLHQQLPLRLFYRYVYLFIKYGTVKKYLNIFGAICGYYSGNEKIKTLPAFLKVEISRYCTVNCLYCSSKKEDIYFSYDAFTRIVDDLSESVFMVQLHEIGEPLQHLRVIDFIKYAHSCGMGTVISTTLSVKKPIEFWQDFVCSGLDYLVVAIDGVTSDVYKKYRRDGDFQLVMENLMTIIELKKRYKTNICIEWQMINFSWNTHQQKSAQKMAYSMGCNSFRVIPEAILRREKNSDLKKVRDNNCVWSFLLLLINAYYEVIPCFKPSCKPGTIGNLHENNIKDIWNGEDIGVIRNRKKIASRPGCMYCRE